MACQSRLVYEKKELRLPGIHSLGRYDYRAAGPGLPFHRHRGCLEINFVIKGRQDFRSGTTAYQVKGGEQYVSFPDELHDTDGRPEGKGIVCWLILNVCADRDRFLFLNRAASRRLVDKLCRLPSRHFVSDPASHENLDQIFANLRGLRQPGECTGIYADQSKLKEDRSDEDSFARELALVGRLHTLLALTIRASRLSARRLSPAVESSLTLISNQQEGWLTVPQLARSLRLSEASFRACFRREMGLPPAEYMLRQKIELAKARLRVRSAPITEVAHSLGFSSSQYFATVFRRFTSLTPSEYVQGRALELRPFIEHR